MSANVVTTSPETLLSDLWSMITQKKINAIPVVDAKKKLLGIVTKEDLLQSLFPEMGDFIDDFMGEGDFEEMEKKISEKSSVKAKEIMNSKVIFTRADTPVMRALSRMIVRSVNQLPVLSDADEVVGVVTKGDVFYALIKGSEAKKRSEVEASASSTFKKEAKAKSKKRGKGK